MSPSPDNPSAVRAGDEASKPIDAPAAFEGMRQQFLGQLNPPAGSVAPGDDGSVASVESASEARVPVSDPSPLPVAVTPQPSSTAGSVAPLLRATEVLIPEALLASEVLIPQALLASPAPALPVLPASLGGFEPVPIEGRRVAAVQAAAAPTAPIARPTETAASAAPAAHLAQSPVSATSSPRQPQPNATVVEQDSAREPEVADVRGIRSLPELTVDELLALPVHSAALAFPLLDGVALESLSEDIRRSGACRQPIWVTFIDGVLTLLDGRNRLVVCQKHNIVPKVSLYEGDDPVAFINSQNLRRRHLTVTDCVKIAQALHPSLKAEAQTRIRSGKRNPEVTCTQGPGGPAARAPQVRDLAAAAAGISGSSVQRHATVESRGSTPLKAAVNAGQIPVHLAAKVATLPDPAQEALVSAVVAQGASPKSIKAMVEAAKSTHAGVRSKPTKAKKPAVTNADPDQWDLTAALAPIAEGFRAEGVLDGTRYEFRIQSGSLHVRKIITGAS